MLQVKNTYLCFKDVIHNALVFPSVVVVVDSGFFAFVFGLPNRMRMQVEAWQTERGVRQCVADAYSAGNQFYGKFQKFW